jgi:hypothetical protein
VISEWRAVDLPDGPAGNEVDNLSAKKAIPDLDLYTRAGIVSP